jgi:hypothetical protein
VGSRFFPAGEQGCDDAGVTLLLVKLSLAPLLVVGSSLAGRRWGPALAGVLGALPLVAGPILLTVQLAARLLAPRQPAPCRA